MIKLFKTSLLEQKINHYLIEIKWFIKSIPITNNIPNLSIRILTILIIIKLIYLSKILLIEYYSRTKEIMNIIHLFIPKKHINQDIIIKNIKRDISITIYNIAILKDFLYILNRRENSSSIILCLINFRISKDFNIPITKKIKRRITIKKIIWIIKKEKQEGISLIIWIIRIMDNIKCTSSIKCIPINFHSSSLIFKIKNFINNFKISEIKICLYSRMNLKKLKVLKMKMMSSLLITSIRNLNKDNTINTDNNNHPITIFIKDLIQSIKWITIHPIWCIKDQNRNSNNPNTITKTTNSTTITNPIIKNNKKGKCSIKNLKKLNKLIVLMDNHLKVKIPLITPSD